MRTTYQEVTLSAAKTGKCRVCGKRLRRQKTFDMTLNPFNKNPDGSIRSRHDILRALDEEADSWLPDFVCHAHAGGESE